MKDWCYLNEEGMKLFGDVFPDKKVPIISILPITFEHPRLLEPNTAYILRGKELTDEQLEKLINKLASRFPEDPDKELIKNEILTNQIPVREILTSGCGTSRPYMYIDDVPSWAEPNER